MNLTRRSFLSAATGLLAAPAFVPARVLADSPNSRINLAAIGVGSWGYNYCWRAFAQPHNDARFVAVADCFASRRESFATQINEKDGRNVCRMYTDYREVLARDDVDAVVIHTPDHWHLPVACEAALAGKDIFIAKPLGLDMRMAKRLRTLCSQKKLVVLYGTQQRSMSMCRLGVDLVRSGFVGRIKRCEVWTPALHDLSWGSTEPASVPEELDYDRWLGPAPYKPYTVDRCTNKGSWHIYDYSLGFIAGWGAHALDILQWGLDRDNTSPVKYEGVGIMPTSDALADTIGEWDVQFEYADGLPVRFMSKNIAKPIVEQYHPAFREDGTTFFGEDGWVSVSRGACYVNKGGRQINVSHITLRDEERTAYVSNDHPRNFLDCVRNRAKTVTPLESGIRSDTISHLSNAAIRLKRVVRWDPEREVVVNDDEASRMLIRDMREPYSFSHLLTD